MNQLPPMIEAGKMLGDLWAVEVAATGKGDETRGMTKDLATRSHELIATALDAMNENLESAFDHASIATYEVDQYGREDEDGRVGE